MKLLHVAPLATSGLSYIQDNMTEMFNRIARAIATAYQISQDSDGTIDLSVYDGIRTTACEIYAQMSAFYHSPKRSDFLKACGVWEPKDGDR